MNDDKLPTIEESLEMMRKNLQTIVESQASMALIFKARYDALVKVGFTEKQALEIVKTRGMNP